MKQREFHQHDWGPLLDDDCRQIVRLAVREDLNRGQDWTTVSLISEASQSAAEVVVRSDGVLAGIAATETILCEMDAQIKWLPHMNDGTQVKAGQPIARLEGSTRDILTSERIVLNFLGRLSGIATLTKKFVNEIADTKAEIYDTRKTTPAWRRLEKYAVRCGGGWNHRTGLSDAILIKDNHLAFVAQEQGKEGESALITAHQRARCFLDRHPELDADTMIIEIEVDDLRQFRSILPTKPDVILLDNMTLHNLEEAVRLRNASCPEVILEASGGVSLETVAAIAQTGVDRISVGALTHTAAWIDVGLDWQA